VNGDAVHDLIVIGAGAAGISAAVECSDIQLDVVVFERAGRVGGQIEEVPHTIRNVVTAAEGNDRLLSDLAQHAATLGDRLHLGEPVRGVDLATGTVDAGEGGHRARSVLIATGSRRRELDVARDGSFGGDVTYLVEPHLERFAGRPMVVVGGGDSAALDALALADGGSAVTLVHRSPRLRARHDVVERVRASDRITELAGWDLAQLIGGSELHAVEVSERNTGERREIHAGGIVLKLGREKCVELVEGQVELGVDGGITVDPALRTSSPGTFAAGDVTEGAYERVATAVGQGSLAAHSVLDYLQSGR
jgi:thioredoxin reductase (NADPH)